MATTPRPVAGLVERPRLNSLLARGSPVTLVCAPAGSGKTMLLTSWLRTLDQPAAWVGVEREETDAARFWGTVLDALRESGAIAAGDPLGTLAPAPGGLDEFLARLREGLERLATPAVLVIDDVHELRSDVALRGLERLLARPPERLRTVIASRHDPKLGLHRLRLTGELTEIRAAELEFSVDEAGELLGGTVSEDDVATLHARTEGWAAGLRLAALSLSRHDAPERFVAEFSGSERTVADYLLGEVLAVAPDDVRRLLLRTCILERVCGPLADALTGRDDGARLLGALEEANAFVVAVDVAREWFRYHHLLSDLLQLELRREAAAEIPELHRRAAGWLEEHGHPVEAIRHAEQARDWALAGELLGRHWVRLLLDGEEATLSALLAGLPDNDDPEIAAIAAFEHLAGTSWREADGLLAAAERGLPGVPAERRRRAEMALATVELFRSRQIGDLEVTVDRAGRMLRGADPLDAELRALALTNLGIAQTWTLRLADAGAHLEEGLALGRRIGSPYVEIGCLTALAVTANLMHELDRAEDLVGQAVGIAERVGWATHPVIAVAYLTFGQIVLDRGRVDEGERWLARADPILRARPEPAANVALCHAQGMLAYFQGRHADAAAKFGEGERSIAELRSTHFLTGIERQWQLRALLAGGDPEPARAALAERGEGAHWCSLAARVCLHDEDAAGAIAAVAPVLAGEQVVVHVNLETEAVLLDAVARHRLGEDAHASVERVLALTEPQARVWIVFSVPGAREVLGAHPAHRTAHPGHLRLLLDQLAGVAPAPEAGAPAEPLSERELAVLRFLPTNLSAAEIGGELFVSVHTVKTHMRRLYAKLDVHTRAEAVQSARALGLLASVRRS
jgi:LuxR family transcriptional regulator, maltose regulon positive regulatory protein